MGGAVTVSRPDPSREVVSRYEAKYVIPEVLAEAVRDYIRGLCSPDSHVGPDGRYLVNNIYFDTLDLRFYYDTRFKQYVRFKPRIRFYGPDPNDVLWLEIKHKVRNVTWKVRRKADSVILPHLFDGMMPPPGERAMVSLSDSFEDIVSRFGARPVLQVQYIREPYVSDLDEYGRITFDRCLNCRPLVGPDSLLSGEPFLPFDDPVSTGYGGSESPVVLEIKTEVQVPQWILALVRTFGLRRRGFSKYCTALERALPEAVAGDRVVAEARRLGDPRLLPGWLEGLGILRGRGSGQD
jgi:hypothetical protein